jgi:hypothetical protein
MAVSRFAWFASAGVAALLVLVAGAHEVPAPGKARLPQRPSSRDQAVAWLRANNAFGPKHRLVDMLAQALDQDVDGGKAFFISLGKRLVKSRKPTMLVGRNGAFQVFEIPPQQAGKWVSDQLIEFKTTAALDEQVEPAPLVVLDQVKLDNAGRLEPGAKLTGSVAYRKLEAFDGALALRLTYVVGDITRIHYYHLARGLAEQQGTLSFSFPPLRDLTHQPVGPFPIFIELCSFASPDRRGKVTVLSTSVPALLNIVASK